LRGDHTFASLRKRLEPTGFYLPVDPLAAAGDKLSIDNLFASQWDSTTQKFAPTYLELEELPLLEQPPHDSGMRRRQVRCRTGAARALAGLPSFLACL
jgi:hypothetical protein